jgi:hypothetical protein
MKRLFLDPQKPLVTCSSADCQDCPLQGRLECHFRGLFLARFLLIALPPFLLGGIGIAHLDGWLLAPWIAIILAYFGLVEIRVMCSHCPHYAEPDTKSLQCWANYGSPKLWRYHPGPMSTGERMAFFAGLALIAGYPLASFIMGRQWLLLALFVLIVLLMAALMSRWMCSRCMNFACPFNRVDGQTRQAFLSLNPVISRAWEQALHPPA